MAATRVNLETYVFPIKLQRPVPAAGMQFD